MAYRNDVEQTAAIGFVIGATWFECVVQSVIGRVNEKANGENFNTGLLSIADRPYTPMLKHMMRTNYGIYDVLMKGRPAFAYAAPKFVVDSAAAVRTVGI